MSYLQSLPPRRMFFVLRAVVLTCLAAQVTVAWAGSIGRNSSVGGVSIDVEGVLGPPSLEGRKKVLAALRREIKAAPSELSSPVELRMVSLKGIESACEDALKNHLGRLPEEVQFLAGLQRIQYIFVYPEDGDIVLAGPGEGWKIDEFANVVGITTNRPVLRLDDLLVALRYVHEARTEGISCSIDPTEEGSRALKQVLQQQQRQRQPAPVLEQAMKRAFGPQQVTVSGIPATSHFARVLVAADYRMKRLAMKLEKSPVAGLPSYLDLIKNSRVAGNVNPRWWLACNYEPLATSEDGLAWELRGPGVQAMTEDEYVAEDGKITGTGRRGSAAQRWADLMTKEYRALSIEDGVFGELRNLMDMCVAAAVIEKEQLLQKAELLLPTLTARDGPLALETWNAPKRVPPEVSFLRTRKALIVTASGGVQVESWQVASKVDVKPEVGQIRQRAAQGAGKRLWWH